MTRPIRPAVAFVLRLWREPGAQEGDVGWRGQLRLLNAGETETYFQGLDDLPVALRQLLAREDMLTIQNVKRDSEK
jgi:hypothetical protein